MPLVMPLVRLYPLEIKPLIGQTSPPLWGLRPRHAIAEHEHDERDHGARNKEHGQCFHQAIPETHWRQSSTFLPPGRVRETLESVPFQGEDIFPQPHIWAPEQAGFRRRQVDAACPVVHRLSAKCVQTAQTIICRRITCESQAKMIQCLVHRRNNCTEHSRVRAPPLRARRPSGA